MAKKAKETFTPTSAQVKLGNAVIIAASALDKLYKGEGDKKDGNGWASIAKALHGGWKASDLKALMNYDTLHAQAQQVIRKSLSVYANAVKYGIEVFGDEGEVLGRTGIETAYQSTDAYKADHAKGADTPEGEGAEKPAVTHKASPEDERNAVLESLGVLLVSPEMRANDAVQALFHKVMDAFKADKATELSGKVTAAQRKAARDAKNAEIKALIEKRTTAETLDLAAMA
jgi:hypothetical protein